MRFTFVLSLVLGTALSRPAASSAANFLPEPLGGHAGAIGSRLSKKDHQYIQKQLEDPYKLKSLLLEDTVAFDVDKLSVPEDEVNKYLIEDVKHNKDSTNRAFQELVAARTELPTPAQARARIATYVDDLAQNDAFDTKLLEAARTIFKSKPELAEIINTMVVHLGGPFDDSLVKLASSFFSVANERNPAVAKKVQNLVNQLQAEFKLLPEDTFGRVQESYLAK